MYKYAINPSRELTICACEINWNEEYGWTEAMYTSELYNCRIIDCPYVDAVLSDFDIEKDVITFNAVSYQKRIQENRCEELRTKRQSILSAFDKYKTNVLLGLEGSTTLSDDILTWYYAVLDLNEDAINNPPEIIKYYL